MGQAQINVRTRACSRTSIARTKQAALTHNVRGKELMMVKTWLQSNLPQGRLVSKVSIISVYVTLQALLAEQEMGSSTTTGQTLTEQILQVMETILQEASEQPPDQYKVRILSHETYTNMLMSGHSYT